VSLLELCTMEISLLPKPRKESQNFDITKPIVTINTFTVWLEAGKFKNIYFKPDKELAEILEKIICERGLVDCVPLDMQGNLISNPYITLQELGVSAIKFLPGTPDQIESYRSFYHEFNSTLWQITEESIETINDDSPKCHKNLIYVINPLPKIVYEENMDIGKDWTECESSSSECTNNVESPKLKLKTGKMDIIKQAGKSIRYSKKKEKRTERLTHTRSSAPTLPPETLVHSRSSIFTKSHKFLLSQSEIIESDETKREKLKSITTRPPPRVGSKRVERHKRTQSTTFKIPPTEDPLTQNNTY